MCKRILACVLLTVAVTVSASTSVEAHHYKIWAQDPVKHEGGSNPLNGMSKQWVKNPQAVNKLTYWVVGRSDANPADHSPGVATWGELVDTAINRWKSAVPTLRWEKASSASAADVKIDVKAACYAASPGTFNRDVDDVDTVRSNLT